MFHEVDIEAWERKSTYEFFRDYDDPFFNIAANLDVTRLYRFCKDNNLPISLAALFLSLQAANEIREFRLRMIDERVVEFDRIEATQTILNEDETFSFCYFRMQDDIFEFDRAGKAAREKYQALKTFDVETDRVRSDLLFGDPVGIVHELQTREPAEQPSDGPADGLWKDVRRGPGEENAILGRGTPRDRRRHSRRETLQSISRKRSIRFR